MPRFLISTNQITKPELDECSKLACNGVWFIGENSPNIIDWSPVKGISDHLLIAEEGAIDRNWLFQAPGYPPPRRLDFNLELAKASGLKVDQSFTYVEHPATMLEIPDANLARDILGKPVLLLARSFTDNIQDNRTKVRAAIKMSSVKGIVFELNPSAKNIRDNRITHGIREVLNAQKQAHILLPPWQNTVNYENDIADAIKELKRSPEYKSSRLHIILACYDRVTNTVGFYGENNSVEAALNWCKRNG